jgi:glutathione S-transferase
MEIATVTSIRSSSSSSSPTLPTLYHVPKTISSPIVQILMDLDLAERVIHIETLSFTDLKSSTHLQRNPMGTSPAFVDANEGITIWESGAVLTYLLTSYDTEYKFHLDPTKTRRKDIADYWHLQQFILATVYPFLASLVVHTTLQPLEEQDSAYVETAKGTFTTRLGPILVKFLGDTPYFLGRTDADDKNIGHTAGPSAIDYLATKPLNNASALGLLDDDSFITLRGHLQRMRTLRSYSKAYGIPEQHQPEQPHPEDSFSSRNLHLVPSLSSSSTTI